MRFNVNLALLKEVTTNQARKSLKDCCCCLTSSEPETLQVSSIGNDKLVTIMKLLSLKPPDLKDEMVLVLDVFRLQQTKHSKAKATTYYLLLSAYCLLITTT